MMRKGHGLDHETLPAEPVVATRWTKRSLPGLSHPAQLRLEFGLSYDGRPRGCHDAEQRCCVLS